MRKLECVRLARVLLRWREFLTRVIAILSSNSIVDYRIYK